MNDEELLKETSSVIVLDESQYSSSNYPEQYLPPAKSSYTESTQGFKSIRITSKQKTPEEVVVRISAKLLSRKEQVRQINEAIKRSSISY